MNTNVFVVDGGGKDDLKFEIGDLRLEEIEERESGFALIHAMNHRNLLQTKKL